MVMVDTLGLVRKGHVAIATESGEEEIKKEFKLNQPVRLSITKAGKNYSFSVEQNNLLHACFKLVSDNSDSPQHRTPELAKMSCKIGIDFRDTSVCFVRPDGQVQLVYRSFAADKLKGQERNKVVQSALEWCAEALGVSVEEMISEAKSRMITY